MLEKDTNWFIASVVGISKVSYAVVILTFLVRDTTFMHPTFLGNEK